jgi:hypothetical protein
MAQQSARRGWDNQGFPLCFEHAVGDFPTTRSNHPNVFPCLKGGVHRWEADIRVWSEDQQKCTTRNALKKGRF